MSDDHTRLDSYMSYKKSNTAHNGKLKINLERKGNRVPENLFGLFTEHLGKNVYGGAWAQALANGGFALMDKELPDVPESHHPDLEKMTQKRLELMAKQFANSRFAEYKKQGTAPYWAPVDFYPQNIGDFSSEKGVNGEAQKIHIKNNKKSDKVDKVGIETPLFLPLHRENRYEFSIKIKVENISEIKKDQSLAVRCQILLLTGEEIDKTYNKDRYKNITPFGLDYEPPYVNPREELLSEERIKLLTGEINGWAQKRILFSVKDDVPDGARLKFRILFEQPGEYFLDQARLFPADALGGWDPEVVTLLKEMNLSCLRFPGGNFSSGYHWQDGIGSREERPGKPNPAWPEWEPNDVGTDEWLKLCEMIGAEPVICVNAGNGSPREAAEWVKYCNDPRTTEWGQKRSKNGHPEPYNVEKWEIGNELWGDFQINWTYAEEYGTRFKKFADQMKTADSSIKIMAVGGSMPDVLKENEQKKREELLGANYAAPALKKYEGEVWGIAEHAVMGGGIPDELPAVKVYEELLAHTHYVVSLLKKNREKMTDLKRSGQIQKTPYVVQTEQMVAVSGADKPADDSLTAALIWAGFVNWFIRSEGQVPLFTRSALINHGDLLKKVRGVTYPLPGYWGQYLYANQEVRYPVEVMLETPLMDAGGEYFKKAEEIPVIDCVGLTNQNKNKVVISAVNRSSSHPVEADIKIDDFALPEYCDKITLGGSSFVSLNHWYDKQNIKPFSEKIYKENDDNFKAFLPPCSLNILKFNLCPENQTLKK